MSIYTPGRGDEQTWGLCTGHPHDPRTAPLPDDYIDADEAVSLSLDAFIATPRIVADWLHDECTAATAPAERYDLLTQRFLKSPGSLSVADLLALLMTCLDKHLPAVRDELCDRMRNNAQVIEAAQDDARDILKAQKREIALWGEDMGFTQ